MAGSQFRRTGLDVGVGLGSRGSPFHGVQILAVPRRELFQREHEGRSRPGFVTAPLSTTRHLLAAHRLVFVVIPYL